MFRATVRLDERANQEKELASLRVKAEGAGLDPASVDLLEASFSQVLASLVETGRILKQQGSQIDVTRKFEDKRYSVTLKFGSGARPGFFAHLWRQLRGR